MKKRLVVVKLGGSVITYKNQKTLRLRRRVLVAFFKAVHNLYKSGQTQIVLVHGAGGAVHSLARQYKLKQGTAAHPQGQHGAVKVRAEVQKLNLRVMQEAIGQKVPAVPVHTASVVTQQDAQIQDIDVSKVVMALEGGYVPMLYGEMVFDTQLDMTVCSGDTLVKELVQRLPVDEVIFATDVDGIYTADPYLNPKATLLEQVSLQNMQEIVVSGSHNVDETGGLEGKLQECTEMLVGGKCKEVKVFNGLKVENYKKMFGGDLKCTRIVK